MIANGPTNFRVEIPRAHEVAVLTKRNKRKHGNRCLVAVHES